MFELMPPEVLASATRWKLPPFAANTAAHNATSGSPRGKLNTAGHLDEIEKAAYEEGFARGQADGYQTGKSEIQAVSSRLNQLLDHLGRPFKDIDAEVEHALVLLAMDVARRLVNEDLQINPQHVAGTVHEAVAALAATPREMKIHLHPEDAAVLKDSLHLSTEASWKLVPDNSLNRGDCRVITESGQIDARLDTRQANITDALLGETA